jgi:hypothetical protein
MACRCHQIAFDTYQRDIREAIKLGEADIAYRMTRYLSKLAYILAAEAQ